MGFDLDGWLARHRQRVEALLSARMKSLTDRAPQRLSEAMAYSLLAGGKLARAAGSAGMVGGQVLDIAEERPAEEAYLLKLHRAKTGALIKSACRMGAIAGGAGEAELAAAESFGDAVGLGFQIADDIL